MRLWGGAGLGLRCFGIAKPLLGCTEAVPATSPIQFISYPKSGRSWIRYVLRTLGADANIAFHHDGVEFNRRSRPRHDYSLRRRKRQYAGHRIVYLERDPRDVLVSLYFQISGRFGDVFKYEGTISDFVRDPYFGAESLRRFLVVWRRLAAELPVHRLTYEEFSADPMQQTRLLLQYLGVEASLEEVRGAVEAASIENMRDVERSGAFPEPWLRLRNGSPKVREGKIGGHRAVLTPSDIAYVESVLGDLLVARG